MPDTVPPDMRPYVEAMFRVDAAEARGDAAAGLSELLERPAGPGGQVFWRPWRILRLQQLGHFDGLLPRWATSRWILDQAAQHPDGHHPVRNVKATEIALDCGADRMLPVDLDPVEKRCRIMDRDWVYRQVFLHELGGLESFLRGEAGADLLAAADDMHAWARSAMGGYRFDGSTSRTVDWVDLASGAFVTLDNLGASVVLVPGDHVIGRLVPIEGGARMFESAPLRVPEEVARRVAADPAGWIEALRAADPDAEPIITSGQRFGLLHDVHPVVWETMLADLVVVDDDSTGWLPPPTSSDVLAQVVLGLARLLASPGPPGWTLDDLDIDDLEAIDVDDVDVWPCVAAAVLHPSVVAELTDLMDLTDGPALDALAQLLAEPARSVCLELVRATRAAA